MDEIEKLKARVERDPNSRLFLPLAEEYRKAGMLDEAISVLLRGLEKHPGYTSARVALGKIYLEKKMVEDARREFEKVIAAIPDNLFAHKKLAEIYRDIGEIDRAIAEYKAVLEINPLDEDAKAFIESIEKPGEEKISEAMETLTEAPLPESVRHAHDETVEELSEEEVIETAEIPAEMTETFERTGEASIPTEEDRAKIPGEEGLTEEFFGIPEDQVFDLSGEEPVEVLPEDMIEVKSPVADIGDIKEHIHEEEVPEQLPETETTGPQEDLYEELSSIQHEFSEPMYREPAEPIEELELVKEDLDLTEADGLVSKGEYFNALDRYKALLKEYPDNKKVLQRIAELKNLLKLLGKDEETVLKLEAFLEGIRRRRDEFFGHS
ncbi:MAG: tetratricopeptide repeat protein [Thermodesulfovibrionales bacterium]